MPVISLLTFAFFATSSFRDEGIAAFQTGWYSKALGFLEKAVATDPTDTQSRIYLALTQAVRNDCEAALPILLSTDGPLRKPAGLAAAKCLAAKGDDLGASKILHDLEQYFPKDADVLYAAAKFHMKAFNDATFAMFQRTPASFRVHQLSAEIFEVEGRYDEAVAEYRKAIELNASAPNLHFRLGRALLMSAHGNEALESARAQFAAELKISPEDAACEFQLGQISQVEGQPDHAAQHFRNALKLSPDFPEALVALAKLATQANRQEEAIPLLEKAIQIQPGSEAAHYALMMAYRNAGQIDRAKAEKSTLERLQKPPEGEFTEFLKKLGAQPPK